MNNKQKHRRILLKLLRVVVNNMQYVCETENINWSHLFQLARSHSIANTLYYAVKGLPADISDPFRLEWLRSVQIDTIQKLEADNVFKQLNAEHIRCVPLKGYVLKNLYRSPEMRSMGDIDILIDAENMPRVTEIMIKSGFTPEQNQGGGNHYVFDKKPFTHVEFHHSLYDISIILSNYFNPGWQYVDDTCPTYQSSNIPTGEESCNSVQLSNCPTYQLTHEGFYLYMLGHIYNHFMIGGSGIRSVMDIWVYNQHFEQQLDWAFINSEFERAGLLQFAQNIKDLSEVWFGTKEPTELLDELGEYIVGSGTYGTSGQAALSEVLRSEDETALGLRKIKAFTKRVFLPLKEMQYRYAFLKKFPILLPVGWAMRGIRVQRTRKDILKSWIANVSDVDKQSLNKHKEMFQRFGL